MQVRKSRCFRDALIILCVVAGSGTTALLADDDPVESRSAEPEREESQSVFSHLVVTAEKKTESLQDVPGSVSVIPEELVESAGLQSIEQAAQWVPNLHIYGFSARRATFPFVRGIGSGIAEPAVTTFIDGVPQLSSSSANIEFLDVQRVEFLKGSQGALYGRNTLGGLIHIVTREPGDSFKLRARAEQGSHDHRRFQFNVDGPIREERLYYGLGVAHSQREGYSNNTFLNLDADGKDTWFSRAQLRFKPRADVDMRLSVHAQRDRDGGYVLYDLDSLREEPYRMQHDFEGSTTRDILAPTLAVDYHGERFDLVSITAFETWEAEDLTDLDFTPQDLIRRRANEDQDQLFQEFRIQSAQPQRLSTQLQLEIMAGLTYHHSEFNHNSVNTYQPGLTQMPFPLEDTAQYTMRDRGYSLFGQATLSYMDHFTAVLGLRHIRETKETDLELLAQTIPPPAPNQRNESLDDDFEDWLPRLILSYRPTPDHMAYFKAEQGYRAGGYNRNVSPSGQYTFGEEESRSLEVGAKTSWLAQRLLINAAVYHIAWNDRQLEVPDPSIPGRYYLDNVGEAESQGAELEIRAQLGPEMTFFSALGLTDATFTRYQDPVSGENVEGRTLPSVPSHDWILGLQFHRDLGNQLGYSLSAEIHGQGRMWYDNANTMSQPAHERANFRAGLNRSAFHLDAWIRNAFDESSIPLALPSPFSPSGYAGRPGEPRTYGLSLRYVY